MAIFCSIVFNLLSILHLQFFAFKLISLFVSFLFLFCMCVSFDAVIVLVVVVIFVMFSLVYKWQGRALVPSVILAPFDFKKL